MSYNLSVVLISPSPTSDVADLLLELNLGKYQKGHDIPLSEVEGWRVRDDIYAGVHNGVLLLMNEVLVDRLLSVATTSIEADFVRVFPEADIVVLSYGSTSTSYNYLIIKKGEKIRFKQGSQGGTVIDHGMLLDMEKELNEEDVITVGDKEDLFADNSKEDAEAIVEGLKGASIFRQLFEHYLGVSDSSLENENIKLSVYRKS